MDARLDRLQRLSSKPGVIRLGGGFPAAELFPRDALSAAFAAALRRPGLSALQYGWPEGSAGLRAWIAARLCARGANVGPEDVITTSGAQQALAIASTLLLTPGSTVAVDAATYPAALDLFRRHGARPTPAAESAACLYVMPGVSNPRGCGIDDCRRATLLAAAVPVIADEAYTELRFDGRMERSLLAEARDRVWLIGTFSKTLCPGLRIGWLVPPPAALRSAVHAKQDDDLQAGSLGQAMLEEFLVREDFDARLARARSFYARRADRLVEALHAEFPSWRVGVPEGGFAVWVETEADVDDLHFLEVATEMGVSFDPGRRFRPSQDANPTALRVCFSAYDPEALREGVRRLGRAWRSIRARPGST